MNNMTLKIDPDTHDLALDQDGNIETLEDNETTAQCVRLTLETFKGTWFMDLNHGADYDSIIDGSVDAKQAVSAAVYQEPAVQHIDNIKLTQSGRSLGIELSARLSDNTALTVEVNV